VRPGADKLLHLGQRLRLGLAPLELAPTPGTPAHFIGRSQNHGRGVGRWRGIGHDVSAEHRCSASWNCFGNGAKLALLRASLSPHLCHFSRCVLHVPEH
jgi:hypothetical protein